MKEEKLLTYQKAIQRANDLKSGKLQIPNLKIQPSDPRFYKLHTLSEILRPYQVNPEIGGKYFYLTDRMEIASGIFDLHYGNVMRHYLVYNTYLTNEDAECEREEELKFKEMRQYKLYCTTQQQELFSIRQAPIYKI